MTIGLEIRKLRKEKGYTQKELAAKAGVSFTHISQVETGNRNISITLLKEIAEALGANKIELFKLAGYLTDDDLGDSGNHEYEKHLRNIANINVRKNMKSSHYHALLLLAVVQAKKALKLE